MNRQELKVAVLTMLVIAAGAITIKFGKLRLGKPGVVIVSGTLTNELGEVIRDQRVNLPPNVPGYRSIDWAISTWETSILPKDTTFGRKIYLSPEGFGTQMSAVVMKSDRTSIHRPQVCVTGQGWKIEKSEVIKIPMASPKPYTLSATCLSLSKELTKENQEKKVRLGGVYIFWFVSENRFASEHHEALWNITKDLLTKGTLYPWAYVSCFSQCPPGSEDLTIARIKRLIAATAPEFQVTTAADKESASIGAADAVEARKQTASLQ
jgi:hypothetical protein